MKTEHTQGEWTVKHSNRGAIVIHDPNGSCIADCNMTADIKTEKRSKRPSNCIRARTYRNGLQAHAVR